MELEQTLKVAKSFRGVLVYFGMQYLIGFAMNALGVVAQASPDAAPLIGLAILGGFVGAIFCLVTRMPPRLALSVYASDPDFRKYNLQT